MKGNKTAKNHETFVGFIVGDNGTTLSHTAILSSISAVQKALDEELNFEPIRGPKLAVVYRLTTGLEEIKIKEMYSSNVFLPAQGKSIQWEPL